MSHSRTLVLAATLIAGAMAASAARGDQAINHRNVLTFSRAIALPGVELPPGSYTFQLADPNSSSEAVMVLNRTRTNVLFMGLTHRVPRPLSLPADRVVTFAESGRGQAAPIGAWYPKGETLGYEFIYRR